MRIREVPVLVVGAGPAGLTAAIALARRGVPTLMVERRRDLSSLPRATVVSTRSMEIFRSWGLEDRILAGSVDVEWQLWLCETLAGAAGGVAHSVGYPTREQSAVLSPTGPACVPQDHLEPVLLAHLRSLPAAEVELGAEVIDVDDRPDGVRVMLRDVATGAMRAVAAQYVVAADGARSTVRRAVGIPMHGPDRLAASATALFRAPLWDVLGAHRYGIYHVSHAEGEGTFLPAGSRQPLAVRSGLRPRVRGAGRLHGGTVRPGDQARRGGTGPLGTRGAGRCVHVRGATRRTLPGGPGIPRRRRRAPGHAARRHRHEHRHRRRLRPGLEACLGAARLGRTRPARLVRGGAPTRRGAQRGPLGRSVRLPAPRRRGTARRSRWTHPARVAAADPYLHTGPARTRIDPLHQSATGPRASCASRVTASCRPRPRLDVRTRHGHPRRRCATGPARRRTGRVVAALAASGLPNPPRPTAESQQSDAQLSHVTSGSGGISWALCSAL